MFGNRNESRDHLACLIQNRCDFGYVPLNDLTIYSSSAVDWKVVPDILEAHKLVLNARIPVVTQLNLDRR